MKSVTDIIKHLGGPTKAADIVGVHRTRVHDWMRSGVIPSRHWQAIIKAGDGAVTLADLYPIASDGRAA
jgi:DNA-binding transcriptional regulator YdaS (Cro superfamily)